MSSTSPPQVVPRRSRRRWYVAAMVLLVVLTPAGYYFVAGWLRNRELEAIYRELDATDPNWRWPDLLASRPAPPPDEQNSALQVLKVREQLGRAPFGIAWNPKIAKGDRNRRLSDEHAIALRAAFSKLGPNVLKDLRELQHMPTGIHPIDVDENPFDGSTKVPPVERSILRAMEVLHSDAFLRGSDGDVEGAAESCQALLHALHSLNGYPTLMAQLLRAAGQDRSTDAIERTLGQGVISKRRLAVLQAALELDSAYNGLYHAMRGERAAGHQFFMLVQEGKASLAEMYANVPGMKSRLTGLFPRWFLGDHVDYLRFQTKIVAACKLDGDEQKEAFRGLERDARAHAKSTWAFLVPTVISTADQQRASRARDRCAIVALAAERYRLEHGNWPTGAGDLVKAGLLKEPLLDPYDGKPLRWKRTPTGLNIYSVGPDLIDNGGNLSRTPAPGSDVGFELWNPSSRGLPASR